MSVINLITPPDKLYNQAGSILLVYPTEDIQNKMQNILVNSTVDTNIYIYNINNDEHQYEWLLDVHKFCNICIMNLDEFPSELKCLESYFISFCNTHYITQGNNLLYNKISQNHIYHLDTIETITKELLQTQEL